jgi:hypothetical protein
MRIKKSERLARPKFIASVCPQELNVNHTQKAIFRFGRIVLRANHSNEP